MKMTLQNSGCFFSGTIQHELIHVLGKFNHLPNNISLVSIHLIIGFFHEQSRPDRDSYVTVNYGNILSGQVRFDWKFINNQLSF